MKSIMTLMILFTFLAIRSFAQNVEIPDAVFLEQLIYEGIDTDGDVLISHAEAEAVTSLAVYAPGLTDMTGIEAFVNLDSLFVWTEAIGPEAQVKHLDLSQNLSLVSVKLGEIGLESLVLPKSDKLTELVMWDNPITCLDISNSIRIARLECMDNPGLAKVYVWDSFFTDSTGIAITFDPDVQCVARNSESRFNIPQEYPSIQQGIEAATEGDTVLVGEGIYYENINFNGKAITVASTFLVDGDTSHISKTIIDGSRSSTADTASTVTIWSGEDTTSVLMGFTVTGGQGTDFTFNEMIRRAGGGVFIRGSGCKIIHNIIEGNHLGQNAGPKKQHGGGVFAFVYNNHTAVIRDNIIRNNRITSTDAYGGGISAWSGRIIIENNLIQNNTADASGWVSGGGINKAYLTADGTIPGSVIRNNIITGNRANTETDYGGGGGCTVGADDNNNEVVQIYNNIICSNHSGWIGGGLLCLTDRINVDLFNNTIIDNTADRGSNIAIAHKIKARIYNNIIWSSETGDYPQVWFWGTTGASIRLINNILAEPIAVTAGVQDFGNFYLAPHYNHDSYELVENSPGIGWGIDSIEFDGTVYFAPSTDIIGNARPDPIDSRIDLGAFESPYEGLVFIPDTVFLDALLDAGVDTNNDSLISFSEAEGVSILQVQTMDPDIIRDATGIEAFVNLDSLDLSFIPCIEREGNLSGLDLSSNNNLRYLRCTYHGLEHLDVSQCAELEYLNCSRNALTVLDLSRNEKLRELNCSGNLLTQLDLRHNIDLSFIDFSNMPSLYKVCIWEIPFPSYGVTVFTMESPNVCFHDCAAPSLTVSGDSIQIPDTSSGSYVMVTCSQDAKIYLVRGYVISDTAAMDPAVIRDNSIDSVTVTACASFTFPHSAALENGEFWIIAIDASGDIIGAHALTIIGVGMEQLSRESFRMYPNPVRDVLFIDDDIALSSVEIFNTIGVKVLEIAIGNEHQVDLTRLVKGMYIIRIQTGDGRVYTGKLLKI